MNTPTTEVDLLLARSVWAGEDSIFAPTPPLESLRMVLSYAVTDFSDEPRKALDPKSPHRCQVLAIDISRGYSDVVSREDEPKYVELPPEVGVAAGTYALLKETHVWDATRCRRMAQRVFRDIAWTGICSRCGVGMCV